MAEACCPPPLTRGSGSGPRWLSSGDAWVCRPVMPGMRLLSTMGALIMMLRSWDTRRMCGEGQQLVARSRRDHVLQWLQADPYWSELGRLQAFRCMALSEEEFKHEEGGYTGRQAPGCKTCNAIDMGHRLQATRVSAWARCFLQLNRRWLIQLTKGVRTALHTLPQEELRGSGNHFFSHCFSDTALTYGVIQVMNDPEHFDGGATRAIERAIPNWDRVIEEVLEGQKLKEWRSTLETFYSPWLVLGRVQLPVRHPSHHNQRRPSHLRHQWAHHNQRRPSHLCHQWAHHQLPWWLDQLPVRCPSHQHHQWARMTITLILKELVWESEHNPWLNQLHGTPASGAGIIAWFTSWRTSAVACLVSRIGTPSSSATWQISTGSPASSA